MSLEDSRSIWNEATQELFTSYHWKKQKGAGKKYNFSYGLRASSHQMDVKNPSHLILDIAGINDSWSVAMTLMQRSMTNHGHTSAAARIHQEIWGGIVTSLTPQCF